MRTSTAEFAKPLDHFGEHLEGDDRLVNRPTPLPASFGAPAAFSPDRFDPDATKYARRFLAATISKHEFDRWIDEHGQLVEKKLAGEASEEDLRRLVYVRWNLDRIEDALYGEQLEMMEQDLLQYEDFCERMKDFIERLKQGTI